MGTYNFQFPDPEFPDPAYSQWNIDPDIPYKSPNIYGGMNPEKGDNDDYVTPEELEKIDKFLKRIDEQYQPPDLPEDDGV